ncbi:DUF397 domain-containing protein [Spongiactinospora sp. 9N601]|uniref:DUF397 domain-containing protein n=1 Tax=Spongiactinospora sp. 9N601 TaxID=3375149 RepID=UPI00379C5998
MDATELSSADLSSAVWKKSNYSADGGGNCVEVADNIPGVIGVRDSKNPTGPALRFTPDEWRTFLTGIKNGKTP